VELQQLREQLACYQSWVAVMSTVVEAGAKGDMEQRVLRCNDSPDLRRLADGINRMLDVSDAFIRESGAALDHSAKGKYFRHVILRGLQGAFRDAAQLINQATEKMARQGRELDSARSRRLQLADIFEREVIGMAQVCLPLPRCCSRHPALWLQRQFKPALKRRQ
jgi:hypothetical protein